MELQFVTEELIHKMYWFQKLISGLTAYTMFVSTATVNISLDHFLLKHF